MKKQKSTNYPYNKVTPFGSIREMVDLAAAAVPDKAAFMFRSENGIGQRTYSEFRKEMIAFGTALHDIGLGETHIACIGDNSYKWVLSFLAVLGSKSVFVPIDKELPEKDILNVLNESESTAVIFAGRYDNLFKNSKESLPNITTYISMEAKEDDDSFISFDRLLERGMKLVDGGDDYYNNLKNDTDILKLLVFTSGTTGLAKGVMLSEHNLISAVYYGLHVSTLYGSCLSVLPYHHTYEAVCGLLVGIHQHVTICINDSLRNVLANLKLFKPEYILLVPAFIEVFYKRVWDEAEKSGKAKMLRKLMKVSGGLEKCGIDLRRKLFKSVISAFGGNLKKIVCGGAPMRAEVGDFFNSIGIRVLNGYGITECSPLVSVNRDYFNDPATVGVPLPCVSIKIDNPDEEGNGEILVKGDVVMMGYYKKPDLTAEVLTDGWFHTGDFGSINEHNQILITGRKKNIIVLRNGKNIYPEEIENYIQSIEYVKEVIVDSFEDSDGQNKLLTAEVYLDESFMNDESIDKISKLKEDVKAVLAELPAYKQVSKITVRDTEFPKTTSNKIKRNYK